MGFLDRKIQDTDITSKGVVAAPDIMTGTAQENKMVFDRLIREKIKDYFNGLIDDLVASTAAAIIGFAATTAIPKNTIQEAIEYCYSTGQGAVATALEYALKAEGYAVGKQNGEDVTSESPYYNANAKYYSEQASGSASSASGSATSAEASKVAAAGSATNAAISASAASGSEGRASDSATTAAGSATEANGYKVAAAGSAETATTKAQEALNSATNAAGSAANADFSRQQAEAAAANAQSWAAQVHYPVSYGEDQSAVIDDTGKARARNNIAAEGTGNKTTEVSGSSTDTQYPSAKSVWDDVYSPLNEDKADRADVLPLINIWDEQWEVGGYSTSTGAKTTDSARIRCSNLIPCKANTAYYWHTPYNGIVLFYNSSKAFISYTDYGGGGVSVSVTTPANTAYMAFQLSASYGTTYNNDISINYPSTYHGYYPSALPRTNAHVGGLGNAIGMRGWNQLIDGHVQNLTIQPRTDIGFNVIDYISGHKYFFSSKGNDANIRFQSDSSYPVHTGLGNYEAIATASNTFTSAPFLYNVSDSAITITNGHFNIIDLTALFGAGNEPSSIADFRAMFPAEYYPYCSGSFGDLLWENASPSASFGAQTISLDLSKYKSVLVFVKGGTDDNGKVGVIANVDDSYYSAIAFYGSALVKRTFSVFSNQVYFYDGKVYSTYAVEEIHNSMCIPLKIYGLR